MANTVTDLDLLDVVAEERLRLADFLDGLHPEQWSATSCCRGWSVQNVVGHLIAGPTGGMAALMGPMMKSGFNLHRANDVVARDLSEQGPDALVATLRDHARHGFSPPGYGMVAPVTDVMIHGQDIALPLGLELTIPARHAVVALNTATSRRFVGVNSRSHLGGLRLVADDFDWSWGQGPVVEGPSMALAHAGWGRAMACDRLHGDGVETLRSRIER